MTEANRFFVRPVFETDLQQIALIYAHHVWTGVGSFDISPPGLKETKAQWTRIVTQGWPYICASPSRDPTRVLGFARAVPFRERAAYEGAYEDSVYVAPGSQGRGLGKALLAQTLADLAEINARQVIAFIGGSDNVASIRLHAALGFAQAGLLPAIGRKFGRDVDVVVMQRPAPSVAGGF